MIEVKDEYLVGTMPVEQIYDKEFKILEVSINQLWNTDEDHPIAVAKARRSDYVESTIKAEPIKDEKPKEATDQTIQETNK